MACVKESIAQDDLAFVGMVFEQRGLSVGPAMPADVHHLENRQVLKALK
jgi:hypothetical protein